MHLQTQPSLTTTSLGRRCPRCSRQLDLTWLDSEPCLIDCGCGLTLDIRRLSLPEILNAMSPPTNPSPLPTDSPTPSSITPSTAVGGHSDNTQHQHKESMKITAMIHHFHGGTSLVTVPESRNVHQACDDVWAAINDSNVDAEGDIIINSGQPGDLISFVGYIPFDQRHAVVESTGFTAFMTTEFAVRHVADRTTILQGVRIYGLKSPAPDDHCDYDIHDARGMSQSCSSCGRDTPTSTLDHNDHCPLCATSSDRDQT